MSPLTSRADQHAAQYRVLVDVLLDTQEHSLTRVGRDELLTSVRDRIAAAAERLTAPDSFEEIVSGLNAATPGMRLWLLLEAGRR